MVDIWLIIPSGTYTLNCDVDIQNVAFYIADWNRVIPNESLVTCKNTDSSYFSSEGLYGSDY
ncbi:hypothetical protein BTO06_01230 [Tenacibaculum sp. SZ-18]|uniref:hypothetical protein n=1 Tax=Tenacibaculum sp. SZ-18 TaxID=754423 RepID=UPI000C2D1CEE|nr:hypothetical protein [Tenacibaculum sp. SZ-18]AUC13856.1 hypothetical protein BTO06_01230 [Tenacibaculum sp. SZ-18]